MKLKYSHPLGYGNSSTHPNSNPLPFLFANVHQNHEQTAPEQLHPQQNSSDNHARAAPLTAGIELNRRAEARPDERAEKSHSEQEQQQKSKLGDDKVSEKGKSIKLFGQNIQMGSSSNSPQLKQQSEKQLDLNKPTGRGSPQQNDVNMRMAMKSNPPAQSSHLPPANNSNLNSPPSSELNKNVGQSEHSSAQNVNDALQYKSFSISSNSNPTQSLSPRFSLQNSNGLRVPHNTPTSNLSAQSIVDDGNAMLKESIIGRGKHWKNAGKENEENISELLRMIVQSYGCLREEPSSNKSVDNASKHSSNQQECTDELGNVGSQQCRASASSSGSARDHTPGSKQHDGRPYWAKSEEPPDPQNELEHVDALLGGEKHFSKILDRSGVGSSHYSYSQPTSSDSKKHSQHSPVNSDQQNRTQISQQSSRSQHTDSQDNSQHLVTNSKPSNSPNWQGKRKRAQRSGPPRRTVKSDNKNDNEERNVEMGKMKGDTLAATARKISFGDKQKGKAKIASSTHKRKVAKIPTPPESSDNSSSYHESEGENSGKLNESIVAQRANNR